jgi:hypothetical protein
VAVVVSVVVVVAVVVVEAVAVAMAVVLVVALRRYSEFYRLDSPAKKKTEPGIPARFRLIVTSRSRRVRP